MEDEMESDSNSRRDIPMDVLTEILTYLPVKPLMRFTCVCKPWLHLIRFNPQFAMKHYLARTTRTPSSLMDNVDYIVQYFGMHGRGCQSVKAEDTLRLCMFGLTNEKKTFRFVKMLEFGPGLGVLVSNFCHGVMCIRVAGSIYTRALGARFLLFNPSTRELVSLPVSPNNATVVFGLGFDPINNDYKIVVAKSRLFLLGHPSWLVDVYSLQRGTWHSLDSTGSLEQFARLKGAPVSNSNGRILNWLGYRNERECVHGLVSFDMVDEVFREIPLPDGLHGMTTDKLHLFPSSRWQACLSFSPSSYFNLKRGEYTDIWVLKGSHCGHGEYMWSKQVSIRFPSDEGLVGSSNLWMNDKELLVYVQKINGSVKELFHYDLGSQEFKRTGRKGLLIDPDGYTESLVSIKGFMPSHKEAAQEDDSNKDGSPEQKDDGECTYLIREIGRRNDVRWSYNFKLV